MAWDQAARFESRSRELECRIDELKRKLDETDHKLKNAARHKNRLQAGMITSDTITVSSGYMTATINRWPTSAPRHIFNGYDEDAIRKRSLMPEPVAAKKQVRELEEWTEKKRLEQERKEVMAFYGDILTDEQKAALGYDLLLDEYKRNETQESRARQYDLQQQARAARDEAEMAGEILRKKLRVRKETEEPTFAGQVAYELAFIPK